MNVIRITFDFATDFTLYFVHLTSKPVPNIPIVRRIQNFRKTVKSASLWQKMWINYMYICVFWSRTHSKKKWQ